MNSKEIFDWLYRHKPFWERNSDEEVDYQKNLKELEEYYKIETFK